MENISTFKANLVGGGARASQFRVQVPGVGQEAGSKLEFLCKASSLPASTIGSIPVAYRGRTIHVAGEREFSPWTITVYNDADFVIRNAFEEWQNKIQNYTAVGGVNQPKDYQEDLVVYQMERNGSVLQTYTIFDAFPTEISAIQLDFESTNQIETFDVTFQFSYFKPGHI